MAVCIDPDCCRVGKKVIPFDSFAIIDKQVKASPDVKAQGVPVYRVGDLHKGVLADAGKHVKAGTSLGSGHVKFTEGQENVIVNGLPVARHDNKCIINCNVDGEGGALAKIVTSESILSMRFSTTKEDFERDLKNYSDAQKDHAEQADKLGEEIEKEKKKLSETSIFERAERGKINDRIAQLKDSQLFHDSMVVEYGKDVARVSDILYSDTPVMSAPPSGSASASYGRMQKESAREVNRIGIALLGPVFGAPAATANRMGAPPEAVDSILKMGLELSGAKGSGSRAPSASLAGGRSPTTQSPSIYSAVSSGVRISQTGGKRLPQDTNVNKKAPTPNEGTGVKDPKQKEYIDKLKNEQRATDIRVGQEQVNINGERVGINKPSLQYTLDGKRYYYSRFENAARIRANDSDGVIILIK
jgi:uncharacterized Zn-binding protein involved in type VI secretion